MAGDVAPLFEQALMQLRESVGILDREGNLLWRNEPLARKLGVAAGSDEPLPVVDWVASSTVPALMRSLIAVETGLTPAGERISLSVTLRGGNDAPVQLIASIQRMELGQNERRVLLIGRARRGRSGHTDGLLPTQVDFLANMSHELRTPLNAVIGYAELLSLPGLVASEDKRRQYALDIRDSGRHLLEMIDDILEFAKAGAGRMTIRAEEFDVVEELNACLKVGEGLAHRMGREIEFHLQADGSVGMARTDLRLFKQIVVNLLSNAVKYSDKTGRVELAVRRSGLWLQVAVRDQGSGIAADEADRIFSAFYQVDGTASRQHGGMGLGLAIVQRFLDLLGGGIRVQSKAGVGSTFTFHVPADARVTPTGEEPLGRAIVITAELPVLGSFEDR